MLATTPTQRAKRDPPGEKRRMGCMMETAVLQSASFKSLVQGKCKYPSQDRFATAKHIEKCIEKVQIGSKIYHDDGFLQINLTMMPAFHHNLTQKHAIWPYISCANIFCRRYSASAAVGRCFGSVETHASPNCTIDSGAASENWTRSFPAATICRMAVSVSRDPTGCYSSRYEYGSVCRSSSDSTTPKENISALSSYLSPSITSGAIQRDVPTPAVMVASIRSREMPKSVTLASIASFNKMLLDLRSRWITGGAHECK
ncbi:hypothetical protein GQ600_5037 [Phytophthora cactorum]|nr:hypothetical protein GQ600_5037 [Phytophthora cactorum]